MISLRGRVFPNHGLVTAQDIGVDSTGTNLAVGLKCNTTFSGCCSDFTTGLNDFVRAGGDPTGNGSWLNAHVTLHPYFSRQVDAPGHTFGITRNGNAVYVFRNKMSAPAAADGIWRCVIPDSSGTEQTKYIGVYSSSSNG